jgi:hypothetical protein
MTATFQFFQIHHELVILHLRHNLKYWQDHEIYDKTNILFISALSIFLIIAVAVDKI